MRLNSVMQMKIPRGGLVVVLVAALAGLLGGEAQAVPSTCAAGAGGIFTITTGDPGGPPALCFDLIGGAAIAGLFLNTFPDGRVTGAGSAVGTPMSGAGEQGARLDIELRGSGVALIDPTFFTNFGGQPAGDYRTSYRLTGSLQKTPGEQTLILGSWNPRFTGVPQPDAPPEFFDLFPPLAGTFPVNRFATAFGAGGGNVTISQDWAR